VWPSRSATYKGFFGRFTGHTGAAATRRISDSINSPHRRSILKSADPTTDNTHEIKDQSDKNSRLVKLSLAAYSDR